MKKNEIFTFKNSKGVEVPGVALYAVTLFDNDKFIGNKWVCYAKNKLFTMIDYKEGLRKYDEPEFDDIIAEHCTIPELDDLLFDYTIKHWKYIKVEYFKNEYKTCDACNVEPMGRKECLSEASIKHKCARAHCDYAVVWEDIPYEDKDKELIDKYPPTRTYLKDEQ